MCRMLSFPIGKDWVGGWGDVVVWGSPTGIQDVEKRWLGGLTYLIVACKYCTWPQSRMQEAVWRSIKQLCSIEPILSGGMTTVVCGVAPS